MMARNRLISAALTTVALVACSALGALAEDAFYREEALDGKVYVFAVVEKYARFQASKELQEPISKEAYGPGGEDVLFDSMAAVALYDVKHPTAGGKHEPTITWRDGRTRLRAEHASLDLSNRVQFRFTEQLPDPTVQLAGTAASGDDLGSFWIRRAKTQLRGWIWNPHLTMEIQIGWAAADTGFVGSTFSGLEDAALTWDVSKNETFEVKVGQYKVPFGRQEFTYSEFLEFVDRDILSGEFTQGRDVGVSVLGYLAGRKLEYRGGMFNGNGRNKPTNDNNRYQYDGTVTYSPWGDVGYSESDFESKDHPLLMVGVEFENNNQFYSTNANNLDTTTVGGEAIFKYRGLYLFGEYFDRKRRFQLGGSSFHSNGYHTQLGYFLVRDKLEVALRYVSWDPTSLIGGNDVSEKGVGLNYFVRKHDLKVQADFRELKDEGAGTTGHELRVQTQFVF